MDKPELVTILIERTYWSCPNPNHHHTTKKISLACKAWRQGAGPKYPRWTEEALQRVLDMKRGGATYKELGVAFQRSAALMRMICCKAERRERYRQWRAENP